MVVPRVLYVNCNGSGAEKVARSLGSKLRRDLPHGRTCLSLYEIAISERQYQRNEKNLSLFLCDPQVEGVYGRPFPMNVSAAIPAVLLDAGYPAGALKGIP
jgi:hypothetical protein